MSDALRKTREAYDGLAETYDRANRSIEDIEGILEAFTSSLEGRLVLDVGCGHGRDAEYFTEQGLDIVGTMLPIFLKNQMDLPFSSIGLFFSGSSVLSLLSQVPGGWLANRYGRKRVIVSFLLPIPLIFGAWAVVNDWVTMLVLYSLFVGCLSMMGSASLALLSDSFPSELTGAAFSVRMTGFRMGSIVGPLLGGYLYAFLSPKSPFIAAGLLFLVGIPPIYLIKEKPRQPD